MGTIVGESFDRFSSNKRQRLADDIGNTDVKRQKTSETSSQLAAQRIQFLTFPGEESRETKFPDRVTVFPQEVWFSIFSASSLQTCGRLARSNYGASVAWHDFRIHVMVQSLNVLPLSVHQKQLVNNLSDYQAMTYYQGQFFVKSGNGNITNEPFNLVDPNLMLLHFRKLPFYKHSQEDLHFAVGFDKKYFNTFANVFQIHALIDEHIEGVVVLGNRPAVNLPTDVDNDLVAQGEARENLAQENEVHIPLDIKRLLNKLMLDLDELELDFDQLLTSLAEPYFNGPMTNDYKIYELLTVLYVSGKDNSKVLDFILEKIDAIKDHQTKLDLIDSMIIFGMECSFSTASGYAFLLKLLDLRKKMKPDDDVEFAHDFITALHQNHENAENLRQNLMSQPPMDGALAAVNLFQNLATNFATHFPEDQNTPLRAVGGLFEDLRAMLQNPDFDEDEMASRVDTLIAPFSDEPPPECNIS